MRGLLFLLAFAALPLVGFPLPRLARVAPPSRSARLATAAACGALVLCAEMLLLSWLGIRWTLPLLLAAPALGLALAILRRRAAPASATPLRRPSVLAGSAAVLVLGAVAYAAGTARATSADLMLFWAAKGQKFAQVRAIDVAFLAVPEHALLHRDYPPLWPCLYAFATLVAGRFAWGASLLTLPLFLGLAALAFFGFARPDLGGRVAGELTLVLVALLGFLLVASGCAGNADPPLAAFEVLALSALVFAGDRRDGLAACGIALAAAVLTKVEGTVFAALAFAAAWAFARRGTRGRVVLLAGLPPLLALSGWVLFIRVHGLADVYGFGSGSRLNLAFLPLVLRETGRVAAYGVWYAPWIAVAALLASGRIRRRALPALAIGIGFAAFVVYLYLS